MKVLHWIAIAVLVKTVTVIGDYSLQISLASFSNPEERDAGGNCCVRNDTSPLEGVCPGACNTTMWFCVQDIDAPPNDFTCTVGMGLIPQSLSSQLIIFSQGPWPGSVQLDVYIIDDRSETLGVLVPGSPIPPGNLIDIAYINNVTVAASAPQSPLREFNGNLSRVNMSLSFQVTCEVNFFGPDCDTICQGRDNSLGHFTCDPLTGNRVCLPGYRIVSADCTECVPLEGCSSIGGFCVDPGECICRTGYFGELCKNRSSLITPSATATPPTVSNIRSSLVEDILSPSSPSSDLVILTSTSSVSVMANPNPFVGSSVTLTRSSTMPTVVLQTQQPTDASGGGLSARTSNTYIVWISVSLTVGLSIFTAVAVMVFAAAVCSHRQKGQVPRKKRDTGSQFISLIYNVNAKNHSSADAIPETLNNDFYLVGWYHKLMELQKKSKILCASHQPYQHKLADKLDYEFSSLSLLAPCHTPTIFPRLSKLHTENLWFYLKNSTYRVLRAINFCPLIDAARDNENENVHVYATLTAGSRDVIPEATYSTFQDNGCYSIKLLMSEDDLDSEERLLNASMSPNSEAEQSEASSSREEKKDYFVPKFNSYDDTMEVKGEFVEPDFQLVANSFGFHNELEQNVSSDLLSCIEETLSHSTQPNNHFPGIISHSADNMTEEKLATESNFETSFIYADHVDDHDAADDNELCISSGISPDSTRA